MKHKKQMRLALLDAAKQFLLYAEYHLRKDPPDIEKARTNIRWVERCHEAVKNAPRIKGDR
jgi:hypothetical protein